MTTKNMKALCVILAVIVVLLAALSIWLAVRQAGFASKYKLYKNIISQDEVENTLFGQPISKERDGE